MAWFENYFMEMNSDKCNLLISGNKAVLGRSDLKFDVHLRNTCMKAKRKLIALSRVRKYLDIDKTRFLFMAFFEYQFKYCHKLFHDRGLYYIETSSLICSENQWTGFYMIETSIMKE